MEDEDSGEVLTSDDNICDSVCRFYAKLYTSEVVDDGWVEDCSRFLDSSRPIARRSHFGSASRNKLGAHFFNGDIVEACKFSNKGSVSGNDGLPYQFWQRFKDRLAPVLVKLAKYMMGGKSLSTGMPCINVSLLHKKGPKEKIRNYRPISLIDTSFRIISIAFVCRLGKFVHQIIPPHQTGFIPKRWIMSNVIIMCMIIEASRMNMMESSDGDGPIFLCLDQEKAYDRVDWRYLWEVLDHFKVPLTLIRLLKSFYASAVARYLINGAYSKTIELGCGLLQGDPVSTLLYVICLQPFLDMIEKADFAPTIFGRFYGSLKIPYSAFADDMTVYLKNSHSLTLFQSLLEQYCRVSNAKFNLTKSFAVDLCFDRATPGPDSYGYRLAEDAILYLGVIVPLDGSEPDFGPLLSRLNSRAGLQSRLKLSLPGRINAANTFITSKIWYAVSFGSIPQTFAEDVTKSLTRWVFHSAKAPVKFEVCCRPKSMGGLNLFHPAYNIIAMQGKSIAYSLVSTDVCGKLTRLVLAEYLQRHLNMPPIFMAIKFPSKTPSRKLGQGNGKSKLLNQCLKVKDQLASSLPEGPRAFDSMSIDQLLSLPWFHPDLYVHHLDHEPDNNITKDLVEAQYYIGYTFRDVLVWDDSDSCFVSVDDYRYTAKSVKHREAWGKFLDHWETGQFIPSTVKSRLT